MNVNSTWMVWEGIQLQSGNSYMWRFCVVLTESTVFIRDVNLSAHLQSRGEMFHFLWHRDIHHLVMMIQRSPSRPGGRGHHCHSAFHWTAGQWYDWWTAVAQSRFSLAHWHMVYFVTRTHTRQIGLQSEQGCIYSGLWKRRICIYLSISFPSGIVSRLLHICIGTLSATEFTWTIISYPLCKMCIPKVWTHKHTASVIFFIGRNKLKFFLCKISNYSMLFRFYNRIMTCWTSQSHWHYV